jgi:cysteine synthase B
MATHLTTATLCSGANVVERIGNTPLCGLTRMGGECPTGQIFFKPEWMNPSGSIKDRSVNAMIDHAERTGRLRYHEVLLDASSGNHGTSLAMLAAARGYRACICAPANIAEERKRAIRGYGADLRLSEAAEGSDGAIRMAAALAASDPGRYCYLDQYSNPMNWQAHYHDTAEEIWRQTGGKVTHFVAVLGTSGTFTGITRKLRLRNRGIRCISLEPDSPQHGMKGMKHMASSLVPAIYDPGLADDSFSICTDEARAMVRRVAREEGILIGITSGAALAGSFRLARTLRKPGVIVTVFADAADKYLSEPIWS